MEKTRVKNISHMRKIQNKLLRMSSIECRKMKEKELGDVVL